MNRRDFLKGAAATAGTLGCVFDRGGDPVVGKPWPGWRDGHFQIHVVYTGVANTRFARLTRAMRRGS